MIIMFLKKTKQIKNKQVFLLFFQNDIDQCLTSFVVVQNDAKS